ncbi:MAG: hypothetical protein ACJ8J0_09940 [Longimicrobiaceae bacterium]
MNEEIGALLDGRLESGPRTELLARLAASDEDFDVFADTAAVLREAEEGDTAENEPSTVPSGQPERSADVIPLRPRRASGWRSPAVRWLAAAAVLAAVGLIPVLQSRAGAWRDPARLAALAAHGKPLPAEWDHPWGAKRGGPGSAATDSGTAARAGALHVDLEVAARATGSPDTAAIAQRARMVAALFDASGRSGSGYLLSLYQTIADSTRFWTRGELLKHVSEAESFASGTDPDYFALGAWTEAALLAADRHDAAFFRAAESRRALERAMRVDGLTEEEKGVVAALRHRIDEGTEIRDWTSVESELGELMQGLAR